MPEIFTSFPLTVPKDFKKVEECHVVEEHQNDAHYRCSRLYYHHHIAHGGMRTELQKVQLNIKSAMRLLTEVAKMLHIIIIIMVFAYFLIMYNMFATSVSKHSHNMMV